MLKKESFSIAQNVIMCYICDHNKTPNKGQDMRKSMQFKNYDFWKTTPSDWYDIRDTREDQFYEVMSDLADDLRSLMEILSGKLPFDKDDLTDCLYRIEHSIEANVLPMGGFELAVVPKPKESPYFEIFKDISLEMTPTFEDVV